MPATGKSSKASNVVSKLRKLGLLEKRFTSSDVKAKQLTFELFFPRGPYFGAQYRAARGKDGLYNFVGLVLGHGGTTVQRIQKASGAKVEVRDCAGNLNGAHPSSHGDPSLHAWVSATSRQRLDRAVGLLLEAMQPTNTSLHAVTVVPGGAVVLAPVVPSDWPEAPAAAAALAVIKAEQAAKRAAAGLASPTKALPAPPPPPAATNAWASNRLLKQHSGDRRQLSPISSLQRTQGRAGSSSTCSSEVGEETLAVAAAACEALPPPPPPPPAPREATAAVVASAASGLLDQQQAGQEEEEQQHLGPNEQQAQEQHQEQPPPPQQQQQQQQQQQAQVGGLVSMLPAVLPPVEMATVWAKGLDAARASIDMPGSPAAFFDGMQPGSPVASPAAQPEAEPAMQPWLSVGDSSANSSWSLWDQGSGAPSFYEQLQAAASDSSFSCPRGSSNTSDGSGSSAPLEGGGFHFLQPPLQALQQQLPLQYHEHALQEPQLYEQQQYNQQQYNQPHQQHQRQPHLAPAPFASPLSGLELGGLGMGLSLGFPPVGAHLGQPPASASAGADSLEAERQMQQLLAAVASMATYDI